MTKAELKEFSAFIKEYKRTHKIEYQKNLPLPAKKKKKEIDESELYVINRPETEAELKEFSAFLKEYWKTHKREYPKNIPPPAKKKKKYSIANSHKEIVSEPKPSYGKKKTTAKRNPKRKKD